MRIWNNGDIDDISIHLIQFQKWSSVLTGEKNPLCGWWYKRWRQSPSYFTSYSSPTPALSTPPPFHPSPFPSIHTMCKPILYEINNSSETTHPDLGTTANTKQQQPPVTAGDWGRHSRREEDLIVPTRCISCFVGGRNITWKFFSYGCVKRELNGCVVGNHAQLTT